MWFPPKSSKNVLSGWCKRPWSKVFFFFQGNHWEGLPTPILTGDCHCDVHVKTFRDSNVRKRRVQKLVATLLHLADNLSDRGNIARQTFSRNWVFCLCNWFGGRNRPGHSPRGSSLVPSSWRLLQCRRLQNKTVLYNSFSFMSNEHIESPNDLPWSTVFRSGVVFEAKSSFMSHSGCLLVSNWRRCLWVKSYHQPPTNKWMDHFLVCHCPKNNCLLCHFAGKDWCGASLFKLQKEACDSHLQCHHL